MVTARVSCSLYAPSAAGGAARRRRIISAEKKALPVQKIPGDCGARIIGPVRDRLDFFYFQGREDFFRSRIRQHGSTVLRLNMPPGPPIAADPAVVAIFDGAAFPVLFDNSKVDKKDLFTGTYAPSVDLTGGYRVLSYLDPSEPNHALIKSFLFYLMGSASGAIIPEFSSSFGAAFDVLEAEIAEQGRADFGEASDEAAFRFLCRAVLRKDPAEGRLGSEGPGLVGKWVLFQLAPLLTLGLPYLLEDVLLHSLRLPPALIRADYRRLYDFFSTATAPALSEAERMGISKEEACHNVIFALCFNAFGGFKILFPTMMKWLARAGIGVHTRLAEEVRAAVRAHGGQVTMRALEEMTLVKSAVYETLRIEPPVPFQYGRARRDLVIESHDAAYQVRSGEMLFGYQPFATRDPRIFERAEEFIVDRFVGDGEKLLRYVVWSNGPETENPTPDNKQCAGKNFVVLVARLLLAEIFLRYDSFEAETRSSPLGNAIYLTSLKKATF
ncbi:allene oxide synthase [Wolffia australiana]